MCVKNINVTGTLFKEVNYENGHKSFEMPFDPIVAKVSNNCSYIENFSIVLNFCLMGTNKDENKNQNVVNQKGVLHVLLRLAKVSKDVEKQLYSDITEFELNLNDENMYISHACVDYVTIRRIFSISQITLDARAGLGEYVFKVLVKTNPEDNWNVQSYIPFRIE